MSSQSVSLPETQEQGPGALPRAFGQYVLLEKLKSGGMAQLHLAKAIGIHDFERLVAIKCLLDEFARDEKYVSMFLDEAQISAQLVHPNIVQIYEFGEADDTLYIAMEFVRGRDLGQILRKARELNVAIPPSLAAYVMTRVADGLHFAHEQRALDGTPLDVVHRDVSPQNILLGYDGQVKLADFGVAKAINRITHTTANVVKGKYSYMAPEQISGECMDRRIDVFALGTVLFEAVTTEQLFLGSSDYETMQKILCLDMPDFFKAMPDAPGEVFAALTSSLVREPDERLASAAQFARLLDPILIDGQGIYGAQDAQEFMRDLFAEEVSSLNDRLAGYAGIRGEAVSKKPEEDGARLELCKPAENTPSSLEQEAGAAQDGDGFRDLAFEAHLQAERELGQGDTSDRRSSQSAAVKIQDAPPPTRGASSRQFPLAALGFAAAFVVISAVLLYEPWKGRGEKSGSGVAYKQRFPKLEFEGSRRGPVTADEVAELYRRARKKNGKEAPTRESAALAESAPNQGAVKKAPRATPHHPTTSSTARKPVLVARKDVPKQENEDLESSRRPLGRFFAPGESVGGEKPKRKDKTEKRLQLPIGTRVRVELDVGISSTKHGQVLARVTHPLRVGGRTALPKGAMVLGRSTSDSRRVYIEFRQAVVGEQKLSLKGMATTGNLPGIEAQIREATLEERQSAELAKGALELGRDIATRLPGVGGAMARTLGEGAVNETQREQEVDRSVVLVVPAGERFEMVITE